MLVSLSIRDVVLIDRLDLAFPSNLSVLTGETGAGKSILLDALGLALGFRAESGLVRNGMAQASVTALFDLAPDHSIFAWLAEQGLSPEDTISLRRVVSADGRSRAFINDQPVSVGLLRHAGDRLVEIQGQFDQHGLLDAGTHRGLLDAFAGNGAAAMSVRDGWRGWRGAADALNEAEASLTRARIEEEWLRHALAELDTLAPREAEEISLAETRSRLQHQGQVLEATASALQEVSGDRGALRALSAAARLLERVRDRAAGTLDPAIAAIERALIETEEVAAALDAAARDDDLGPNRLEQIEERLFALRALARKHSVSVDGLVPLQQDFARRLAALDSGEAGLKTLKLAERQARIRFDSACAVLSASRRDAAMRLDAAVAAELPPLKLERAVFRTSLTALKPDAWGEAGAESVAFEIATNPGAAPGPLDRIASGGELSRFLLALKLVLARISTVPTIVFDEVDSGIGGAVAAAVGERLHRLGRETQVLVVTHSPQVAARGDHHWRVAKSIEEGRSLTRVSGLTMTERHEEIARMLAGAEITPEARAAAKSLLSTSPPLI